jgi:hypothetical protein
MICQCDTPRCVFPARPTYQGLPSICLHFVVERGPVSATFHFEYSLDLEAVTVAQGRGFLSINNDATDNRRDFSTGTSSVCGRCVKCFCSVRPLFPSE